MSMNNTISILVDWSKPIKHMVKGKVIETKLAINNVGGPMLPNSKSAVVAHHVLHSKMYNELKVWFYKHRAIA